jgi:hypothetical protein
MLSQYRPQAYWHLFCHFQENGNSGCDPRKLKND